MKTLLANHLAAPPSPAPTAALIAVELDEVEQILQRALVSPHARVAPLLDHLKHYRGKRLRPNLLLLTAHACGSISAAHPILAAVVEMIHTATLVHDDVLDAADSRRHTVTINQRWGNQASILLGDMLFSRAFHLAATTGDARACAIIGRATDRVCEGELLQTGEQGNLHLDEATYFQIIDGKTAELTACCCRLGAVYAGADDYVTEQLAHYGRCLGLAFQIADDLLDLTGIEDKAGKTLGTDLGQLKLTLPLIHLLRTVSPDEAERIRLVLRQAGGDRRPFLLPLLREAGSLGYARQRAELLVSTARANLSTLPPSDYRALLERIADWSLRRDS